MLVFSKYLKSKLDILVAFQFIALMAILHNLIGWYEITTGNYLFLAVERVAAYTRKTYPVSMFGNTNDFATFMLFSVFILYALAQNVKKPFLKLTYLATMLSSVYLLVMTSSRANILGLIIATAVFVYFSIRRRRSRNAIIVVLLSGFFVILFFPEVIVNAFSMISNELYFRFSADSGSDATRMNLIKNGFMFLLSTSGFGTGAGNIEYWMANYGVYNTGSIRNIHNWWMEILTGYGLIIFTMYIIFYVKLFLSALRRFKKASDEVDVSLSLGIMCCLAGFTIGGISSSSNIGSEWLWVFWAIVIAYQGIEFEHRANISTIIPFITGPYKND